MDAVAASKNIWKEKDARDDTTLLMAPYANWEEFLMPCPFALVSLSELVCYSVSTEFFEVVHDPEFFRRCVLQLIISSQDAFSEANNSMCHIIALSSNVITSANIVIGILMQDNDQKVARLLPYHLKKIQATTEACIKLHTAVDKKFTDVINSILKLMKACVNADNTSGGQMTEMQTKISELERKAKDETGKKQVEQLLNELNKHFVNATKGFERIMDLLPVWVKDASMPVGKSLLCPLVTNIFSTVGVMARLESALVANSILPHGFWHLVALVKVIMKSLQSGHRFLSCETLGSIIECLLIVFDVQTQPCLTICTEVKNILTNLRAIVPDSTPKNFVALILDKLEYIMQMIEQFDIQNKGFKGKFIEVKEAKKKATERMCNNELQLRDIMATSGDEINLETTIEKLENVLDSMGKVQEQWAKMVRFFDVISVITKTSLNESLPDFVSTVEHADSPRLDYTAKKFKKDIVYIQVFQASSIASLIYSIADTYTKVSDDYLTDIIRSMENNTVMFTFDSPEFQTQHNSLRKGCKEAEISIMSLVLTNKAEFDRQVDARIAKIDQELRESYPANGEEIRKIKETDNRLMKGLATEADFQSVLWRWCILASLLSALAVGGGALWFERYSRQ